MVRPSRLWILGAAAAVALGVGAAPAAGSIAGTDVFLPSVGSGAGVAPSVWYTTLWVFNPNASAVVVTFSLLLRDQGNEIPATATLSVGPGAVAQVDDAVATLFGVQGFGALRVQAPDEVHVSARIYSKAAGETERDSVGQAFAAVPADLAIGVGQSADLLGVTSEAAGDFRYNVGFVETTGQQAILRLEVWSDIGTPWMTSGIGLQGFEQKQLAFRDLIQGIGEAPNCRLRVIGSSGEGRVIVFGSRIANGSQDPTTFEMSYPVLVPTPTDAP